MRTTLIAAIATLLAALFVVPAAAADASVQAILDAIEAKYAGMGAMEADFVQVTKSSVFGDEELSGHVVLQRPDRMRWSFGDDKLFVTDGKQMWVYTKADNQVIKYGDIGAQRSSLDSLLGSLDKVEEQFGVALVDKTEDKVVLDLTPKDEQQVKKVELTLDADYVISHITLIDPFDAKTELSFSNVQMNVEVPEGTFTFTAPEGAEVIDAGQF